MSRYRHLGEEREFDWPWFWAGAILAATLLAGYKIASLPERDDAFNGYMENCIRHETERRCIEIYRWTRENPNG